MHGIIVSGAAEGGEAAEDGDGFVRVCWGEVEVLACEFWDYWETAENFC